MSVSGGCFKTEVMFRCKVVLDLSEKADGQEGGSDDDVEAVEACCYEESRAINPVGDGERGFVVF